MTKQKCIPFAHLGTYFVKLVNSKRYRLISSFWSSILVKRVFQVIDKNGPPPTGTGIKQIRENIAESKLSYEIMDDAAQAFLKTKIMDNIQVGDLRIT